MILSFKRYGVKKYTCIFASIIFFILLKLIVDFFGLSCADSVEIDLRADHDEMIELIYSPDSSFKKQYKAEMKEGTKKNNVKKDSQNHQRKIN